MEAVSGRKDGDPTQYRGSERRDMRLLVDPSLCDGVGVGIAP